MMRKIRILYTIPNFNTAGSGKVVYDLVKGLDKSWFEPEIACNSRNGEFFKTVESLNIPVHIIETTTGYRPYFSLYGRLRRISKFFKSQNYDVIHSWHWSSDWTEAAAARMAGIPWVYTKKAMSWGSKHWKIRTYLANFVITINDEMHHFFPSKVNQQLIPLGIDTFYYNPDLFVNSKSTDVFNIITVANLVAVKNIEIIIQAIYALKDVSIDLYIVGDTRGSYADTLKQLVVDFRLTEQIFFLGKQADVRPLFANADLYVISSKQEGMPMALVEAMSMGIPILGSDISGIKYVLKDFPELLFEAGNSQALATSILEMFQMTQYKRTELGKKLREYCLENFSMAQFIKAHESLYKRL